MRATSQHAAALQLSAQTQHLDKLWQQALDILGPEPLLCAPLMTMSGELFPDRWREDLGSARRVLVRTLAYLGISVPDLKVEVVDEDSSMVPPRLGHRQELVAWFLRWDDQVPCIALGQASLAKPALLLPSLVRAGIHAFLVREGKLGSQEHASALLDVMGICLGWGIVLTHASHVLVQSSGRATYTQLTQLPPAAMATCLAFFASARRLDPKSARGIAKALAPNQRDAFDRAFRAIQGQTLALPEALLKLPEPSAWPPMWSLPLRVQDARDAIKNLAPLEKKQEAQGVQRGIVGKNKGKPVFMVRRRLSMRIMKFGVGSVFAASMLLRADPSLQINTGQLMLGGAALVLLGGVVGFFLHEQRCSDAKCDARLKADDKVCPRCGGDIRGVISNAKERLSAEDALEQGDLG